MNGTFTPMRREKRALPLDETQKLLAMAKWGVLSFVADQHGYPHAVPINCAYVDGELLFHCAKEGKKLDSLDSDARACFSATISHTLIPEDMTAHFECVICYGRVSRVPEEEKQRALIAFTAKVFDLPEAEIANDVATCAAPTQMLRMQIDHLTGKRNGPHRSV